MQMSSLVARGRVIAAARMLAGLDQHQLAAAAGLSPSTISKIEQGRKNVRRETLRAVGEALERLGVDVTQNGRTGHHAVGTSYA
ncbi:MAG: helix-turn-helix transcriptional regulator [Acetobacteraceae bacterium]|nr:helix-turn-helix transcriptional regulator [Acetobacteraceae bacterium]